MLKGRIVPGLLVVSLVALAALVGRRRGRGRRGPGTAMNTRSRLLCTRTVGGKVRAVYAGGGMAEGMFVKNALLAQPSDAGKGKTDPKDGFLVVVERKPAP